MFAAQIRKNKLFLSFSLFQTENFYFGFDKLSSTLLATFDDTKLVPQIDAFVNDNVRLFTVISRVVFNDFDHRSSSQLRFQIVASVGANDDEEKYHNLVRSTGDAVKDSD